MERAGMAAAASASAGCGTGGRPECHASLAGGAPAAVFIACPATTGCSCCGCGVGDCCAGGWADSCVGAHLLLVNDLDGACVGLAGGFACVRGTMCEPVDGVLNTCAAVREDNPPNTPLHAPPLPAVADVLLPDAAAPTLGSSLACLASNCSLILSMSDWETLSAASPGAALAAMDFQSLDAAGASRAAPCALRWGLPCSSCWRVWADDESMGPSSDTGGASARAEVHLAELAARKVLLYGASLGA